MTDNILGLPIHALKREIQEAIQAHSVVIIAGATGSGKTTQLPQFCLELGLGVSGKIGHTQPRRIAARAVAERIAEETKTSLGDLVGYQIRFTDKTNEQTRIKVMTDGILLAELSSDPLLLAYDTIIIDEAHERSLNIDFILGCLKNLVPKRPDLKIIVTSATIDVLAFSKHFQNAPIIEVSGRLYPVDVHYLSEESVSEPLDLSERVVETVKKIPFYPEGDILVFLPGERDILDAEEAIRAANLKGVETFALYGRLSVEKQHQVFSAHVGRRIILSTNVAETSLTVPNIRYVIDSGLARVSRYSTRLKIQQLPIEPISKASADQRKGRCGRVSHGQCYRLYTEADFLGRSEYTDPEILRTNLAQVLLQMAYLRLGSPRNFPFLSPPDTKYIQDGIQLLKLLGAFNEREQLTSIGREMARLPLDPRLARILVAAKYQHTQKEMLLIVSFLSTSDPRERPMNAQEQARTQHQTFSDPQSDFMGILKLHDIVSDHKEQNTRRVFKEYCEKKFISVRRWFEWKDVKEQIRDLLGEVKFGDKPATYAQIHQTLLTGLFDCIGLKQETGEYLGPRGLKFYIFPTSYVKSKPPQWIVTFGLMQTTKMYAPFVAKVEPEWIEHAGKPWLKYHYDAPHWEKKMGIVGALMRITLFGLELAHSRRVNYGPLDPKMSRSIFIQEALVPGALTELPDFLKHNVEQCSFIEDLEHRVRSKDILITEAEMADFYDHRLPETVYDSVTLAHWLKQNDNTKILYFDVQDLYQRDPSQSLEQYPAHLEVRGVRFPLSYRFEPGHQQDGASLKIPLAAMTQFKTSDFEWMVPGLYLEKITTLIKGLPKTWRRHFAPAQEFAKSFLGTAPDVSKPLLPQLTQALKRMTGVEVPLELWQPGILPVHLQMCFELMDLSGQVVRRTRQLEEMAIAYSTSVAVSTSCEPHQWTQWPEEALPDPLIEFHQGVPVTYYFGLEDRKTHVIVQKYLNKQQAECLHRRGVCRVLQLILSREIKVFQRNLPNKKSLFDLYRPLGKEETCLEALWEASIEWSIKEPLETVRTSEHFNVILQKARKQCLTALQTLALLLEKILKQAWISKKEIDRIGPKCDAETFKNIQVQWEHLIFPQFWVGVSPSWLNRYPVYLEAIAIRLEKAVVEPKKDIIALKSLRVYEKSLWNSQKLETVWLPEWEEFRFSIEECRVMLFAQKLKTLQSVSTQRLQKMLAQLLKKENGSSLIEVLVAMTILFSVMAVGVEAFLYIQTRQAALIIQLYEI